MKMLIPVNYWGLLKQEVVEIDLVIHLKGLRFGLHRPSKKERYRDQLWSISEIETGILICSGMFKDFTIKKAINIIEKQHELILEKKEDFYTKLYLVD
ncbi:hypothetical protein [Metabacillus niabensis]|uniref:hypothetical protein n=1 Tax=Metabacillus niabensis TaxID=324854 RepID=UPI0039A3A133